MPPPLGVIVVRDGRHALVQLLMASAVISGLLGVFGPENSAAVIDKLVPEPWRTAYYALLTLAGIIGFAGAWLRDIRDRLQVEQIAMWLLSGAILLYPLAIYVFFPGRLGYGGVVSCLIGFGALLRIGDIVLTLRRLRRIERGP